MRSRKRIIGAIIVLMLAGAMTACDANINLNSSSESSSSAESMVSQSEKTSDNNVQSSTTVSSATKSTTTQASDEESKSESIFEGSENEAVTDSVAEGYIERSEALAQVKSQAGSGSEIINAYEGETPDGIKAWVVEVSPITRTEEPVTLTYYCNADFCYVAQSDEDETEQDGFISQADAVSQVRSQVGSGAQILNVTEDYTPEGLKAWVIIVTPVTTEEGPETVTYYVGDGFCYSE